MESVLYVFNIHGIKSNIEMNSILAKINNCEFCNNGTFHIDLKHFHLNRKANIGVTIAEIMFQKSIDIHDKIFEMLNCEFCHSDIGEIIVKVI